MALEDYLEPEVVVTAAVTAAIFSPTARRWIRRGLVYGTAGVLIAGDAVTSLARNVGQGVQQAGAAAANATQHVANQAKETAASATETSTGSSARKNSTPTTTTDSPSSPMEGTAG
jgi:hypothetical protein